MRRFEGNPILEPIATHAWESRGIFNAATLFLRGGVHILYRALGHDNISRIGYAYSKDGYHIDERMPLPVFEPSKPEEQNGCEDPRLTLQNGRCIMAYTALGNRFLNNFQISLTFIESEDLCNRKWNWGERILPFPGVRNKDGLILPKKIRGQYVMIHRIDPDVCVAYSDNLKRWCDLKAVAGPRTGKWDCLKVGAAGPPIELNEGWLFIYHGVDFDKVYRLGVMILDKDYPEKVLYRSDEPILEPEKDYERFGNVHNVVFSCGNALMDDQLLVYYGGADSVLCVASFDLGELTP
jgi:predicted GH43/DUF377 family glycosyl hydrolase